MKLFRNEIVDRLQENGDIGSAHTAWAHLPYEIDTDLDQDLLAQLGVDVETLLRDARAGADAPASGRQPLSRPSGS